MSESVYVCMCSCGRRFCTALKLYQKVLQRETLKTRCRKVRHASTSVNSDGMQSSLATRSIQSGGFHKNVKLYTHETGFEGVRDNQRITVSARNYEDGSYRVPWQMFCASVTLRALENI